MQAEVENEVSAAVSSLAKAGNGILDSIGQGKVILEGWKTPLGFLFANNPFRGERCPPPGGVLFFSCFSGGRVESSPFPFDGTGAKFPQKRIGEIEVDFTADPPTWREVG